MRIEIRKVRTKKDLDTLVRIDRLSFSPGDVYEAHAWKDYAAYLFILGGKPIGSVAFRFNAEISDGNEFYYSYGTLYIGSMAILPKYQGRGWGTFLKAWQIAFAREKGFLRIVTTVRVGNKRIINLNKKFGFQVVKRIPNFYNDPPDDAFVVELWLKTSSS